MPGRNVTALKWIENFKNIFNNCSFILGTYLLFKQWFIFHQLLITFVLSRNSMCRIAKSDEGGCQKKIADPK